MRRSMTSHVRSLRIDGSSPTLRIRRSFHSLNVKSDLPRHSVSSTSLFDSWISRRDSMPKGRPAVSSAMLGSYAAVAGRAPLRCPRKHAERAECSIERVGALRPANRQQLQIVILYMMEV